MTENEVIEKLEFFKKAIINLKNENSSLSEAASNSEIENGKTIENTNNSRDYGTTIINFVNPYCLFNSNIVLKNTYVLPVPVSISISKSYSPGFIILDGGNPFFN